MSAGPSLAPSDPAQPSCLEALRSTISAPRDALLRHPIYDAVDSLPRLRRFMGHHVFAVWDFMCLVKRLQRDLTCLDDLWLPPARPSLARFINTIVVGEESDVDPAGDAASHFELYLSAMEEVGASVVAARDFIARLRSGAAVDEALRDADVPAPARTFVRHTLRTVRQASTLEVLSSFLFGREDLIPEMFTRLLPRWSAVPSAGRFAYYVERHIVLDGDDHGPMGERALAEMAGVDTSAWDAAGRAARAAIEARIVLWDGTYADVAAV